MRDIAINLQGDTLQKACAFVMTLSFSRHSYVEFVFDQARHSSPRWRSAIT